MSDVVSPNALGGAASHVVAPPVPAGAPLVEVRGLRKEYPIGGGFLGRARATVHAVAGVDLTVRTGETLGIVGESGSGKSTLGRCILRLTEPTAGSVSFDGRDVLALSGRDLRAMRRDMQIVFQDPYASLNPRMRIGAIVAEGIEIHDLARGAAKRARVHELLEKVGLSPEHYDRYPHEFSGGQRQRVGIARALAVEPKVVLLDEPTASLDVSIRGQILDLLGRLQREQGLAYLFITHDLQTVRAIADRVLVMYLGSILEEGPTQMVFDHPTHPYTRALLSSAPVPEYGRHKERFVLTGEIPSPIDLPTGCRLATRCPLARAQCSTSIPPLLAVSPGHAVACPVVLEASQSRPTGAPSDLTQHPSHPSSRT